MNITLQKILLAVSIWFAPMFAIAHPVHGSFAFNSGVLHPITGFDHLIMLVAFGALVGCLSVSRAQKMTFVGVALIVLVVGALAGKMLGSLPSVETIILSSLFVISAALWLAFTASQKMLKLIAAFCICLMFFHGFAHGVEAQNALAVFTLGMAITATLLMFLGIKLGQYIASRWLSVGIASLSSLLIIAS